MPIVEARPVQKEEVKVQGNRVDEKLMKPGKYEVTDQHTFKIEINLVFRDKRWVIVDNPGKGIESHEVVFRMWAYDEMVELRKLATNYDSQKRIHLTDNDVLNRLKVQRLIVSWTFERDNPRLKLLHVNGILSDESWQAFTKLQPNIITYIFEEMNRVYEFNG
jgi:hypothetical protein